MYTRSSEPVYIALVGEAYTGCGVWHRAAGAARGVGIVWKSISCPRTSDVRIMERYGRRNNAKFCNFNHEPLEKRDGDCMLEITRPGTIY